MRVYNTPKRQVEDFTPINEKTVTLYTCGPTVYDRIHIGNWVSYIRWDTLVRLLQYDDYKVKRVLNITDVGHLVSDADEGEDKLEKGARREGKTAQEVGTAYTQDFLNGMKRLNLIDPTYIAKATEHIAEQIELVKKLEEKNFTYVITDGVYFDTSKFKPYADFAHLDLDGEREGARVKVNTEKKRPQDFALWKFSPKDKKRDMEWDSPWGKGFPGWHLECSAMAMKYLGETIDIHTGGIDHIPVHHTNEIAQSEAATGKRFVNYWLHNNFLLVDGQKISKSLENGYTLDDLRQKGFSAADFKMFVLQSHYRTESNFTWENLQGAQARLADLRAFADMRWQLEKSGAKSDLSAPRMKILAALNDDLNTPEALSGLSELTSTHEIFGADGEEFKTFLDFLDALFGFELGGRKDISEQQKQLIDERERAREAQDWPKADELRANLAEQGIDINDTSYGPIWSRVRT